MSSNLCGCRTEYSVRQCGNRFVNLEDKIMFQLDFQDVESLDRHDPCTLPRGDLRNASVGMSASK